MDDQCKESKEKKVDCEGSFTDQIGHRSTWRAREDGERRRLTPRHWGQTLRVEVLGASSSPDPSLQDQFQHSVFPPGLWGCHFLTLTPDSFDPVREGRVKPFTHDLLCIRHSKDSGSTPLPFYFCTSSWSQSRYLGFPYKGRRPTRTFYDPSPSWSIPFGSRLFSPVISTVESFFPSFEPVTLS